MPEPAGASEPTPTVIGDGRVAVVTGAASGIGRALAEAFVAAGSAVVLADLDGQEAETVAERLRLDGGAAPAGPVDAAQPASVGHPPPRTPARVRPVYGAGHTPAGP